MPPWGWVLVALVGFGALQLLALRYALRQDGPEMGSHGVGPYPVEPARVEDGRVEEARADDVETTRSGRQCPRCGAENRAGFTYCRNCVGLLPG